LNQWRVFWRAITKNRLSMLTAGVFIVGMIVVTELVMVHRYRLGFQWGPDKRFELAPAPASSASLP
jgi:hypothetical protein